MRLASPTPESPSQHASPDLTHPLERAGWLSQLTMWWMNDTIRRGYDSPLEEVDVADLPREDRAELLQQVFSEHYKATASSMKSTTTPPIHSAMWNATKRTMAPAIALYFLSAAASLLQPLVIKALLQFLQDPTTPNLLQIDSGYGLAALLSGTSLVSVSALDFGMFRATRAGIQARTIVVNAVFQKTLVLSSTARQSMNSGDVITLAGVDSDRLYDAYANGLWAIVSPAMVSVVCLLLGFSMGWLVGVVAAVCAVVILTFATANSRRIGQLRRRILKISGERVQLTNEVLQGVRVIKMYAWEDAILQRIAAIRAREITMLRRYSYMRATNYVVLTMGQTFMAAVCLIVYVYQGNTLTVPTAFSLLAFTNVCRMPFSVFSNAAVFANEAVASMDRIAKFLAADEVNIHTQQPDLQDGELAVTIQDASFAWDAPATGASADTEQHPPILQGINFVAQQQSLTIIVGGVGSGKSSLMSALLGEMHQLQGSLSVRGAIAYASQQPWIQHNTVRENILFGSPYDVALYNRVIEACQLTRDLEILDQGDATEIGERGINLSGGQKARVSLARVMYRLARADLLVLDDPLSALDVHVANAVFHQCVMDLASSKTRLLVLNTHYHLLQYADQIVVLDRGSVVGSGTYEEITTRFPHLADRVGEKVVTQSETETPTAGKEAVVAKAVERRDEDTESNNVEDKSLLKAPAKPMMLAEDRAIGGITWGTYVDFVACSGWGNGVVLLVSLLAIFALGQCAVVASDYFLTFWANGELRSWISRETIVMWVFVVIAAVATLLSIVRAVVFTEMCIRSSEAMHARYFKKVLLAPIATFFDVTPVGQVLNRFSRDLDQIDNPLPYFALALLVYLMLTVAILVVCAVATPTTLVLYPPLWYACYWVQKRFLATSRELKRLDGITRSPFLNLVAETINGLESIRAFAMTPHFSQKCRDLIDYNAKFYFMFQQSTNWFVMRLDWLVTTVVIAVSFTCVVWQTSVGAASAGLALTYAVQLTMNFQRMMTRASSTDNFLTSFERLAHYGSLAEEGTSSTAVALHNASEATTTSSSWPSHGCIEFKDVWLQYRDGLDCVLRGVSFTITGGEKIGVCGRTGSGKSTLMNAIFRTIEQLAQGRVLIDGVDIFSLPVRELRARLTIVPQDPVLFTGSLRDNLDPFHDKSDVELFEVLRKVRLIDDVSKWGHGLEYQVIEKGGNLSVGQRQLLCIARALLRQSKIVLIDEATASVDKALDQWIQIVLKQNFQACTTLTIAHRLDTIVDSDRILVMDNGVVAEFDSPDKLMAKTGSHFASLMVSMASR